jgi:hypothetical protein
LNRTTKNFLRRRDGLHNLASQYLSEKVSSSSLENPSTALKALRTDPSIQDWTSKGHSRSEVALGLRTTGGLGGRTKEWLYGQKEIIAIYDEIVGLEHQLYRIKAQRLVLRAAKLE